MVARRTDNDWVNSTKLLNVGVFLLKRVAVVCGSRKTQCRVLLPRQMVDGLSRGKRDMFLKNEPDRLVFRRGALHLKVGCLSSDLPWHDSDHFLVRVQGVWCALSRIPSTA